MAPVHTSTLSDLVRSVLSVACCAVPAVLSLHIQTTELRDGYAGLVEGGQTRRKVDPTDPTSATYW